MGVMTDSMLLRVWRLKKEVYAVGKCQTPVLSPLPTPPGPVGNGLGEVD